MGFSYQGTGQTLVPHWGGGGLSVAYANKVVSTFGASLIAYWPLWETSGTIADNYEGTAARDGGYIGVTLGQAGIGDGRTAPLFDGSSDYVDIYSASLASVFNGAAGTVALWIQVANAGVWTDGTLRYAIRFYVDSSNYVIINRNASDNVLTLLYRAGAASDFVNIASLSSTGWLHLALTWDRAAGASGELKAYLDGAQSGTTQTTLGNWAGSLNTNITLIGAGTQTPTAAWNGYIAHVAVGDSALAPASIAQLATV